MLAEWEGCNLISRPYNMKTTNDLSLIYATIMAAEHAHASAAKTIVHNNRVALAESDGVIRYFESN